ncbi:MAG TPA: efflux RND transporter periplasmic adaptor subunit [Pseudomonadota bacterium]|nr:efflux RND transporter periplasmic adaptor subunit [Pseudomonadota bacterium]
MSEHPPPTPVKNLPIPVIVFALVALVGVITLALFLHARSGENRVALSQTPRGVSVVAAQASQYRPTRRYVGTVAPWLEARIGPQFTSAYVDTVLVRPGEPAARGQVLATLECKSASAQSRAMQQQARALSATQVAIESEAGRLSGLLAGGYVSPNEVERREAESKSKQAELLAQNARMVRAALEVDDCVLRAPFDGEVAERLLDPGGFARPGAAILTLVDRARVRVLLDVPEADFALVRPETPVRLHLLATGGDLEGKIARRAPAADGATRTVHAEIDLDNPSQQIPVGTTAELTIGIREPQPATQIPLRAAAVRGEQAALFVVREHHAHSLKIAVLGESGGSLFVAPTLLAGTPVVTEGRALLSDGDPVSERVETPPTAPPAAPAEQAKPAASPEVRR